MFKFVNEYNKKYYNEINRNVLSKMHEDECIKNSKEILNCDFENSGIDRIYIPKTVTEIDYYAFEDFNGKFYYEGSQQEWKDISYFYDKPISFGIEFNQKYK